MKTGALGWRAGRAERLTVMVVAADLAQDEKADEAPDQQGNRLKALDLGVREAPIAQRPAPSHQL